MVDSNNNFKIFRKIFLLITFLFFLIFATFFYKESYRISIVTKSMEVYKEFLIIDSVLNKKSNYESRLCDFYIASSFRSCMGKNQRFDYMSTDILKSVIESGARMLWFDVFNSNVTIKADPIISNGIDKGNWTYTLNYLNFEDILKTIATNAFNPGLINNYNDPLIISLNLNVQNNILTLNKMKTLILKHLKPRLLPVRYGYAKKNIGEVTIRELLGKIVIITSGGYRDSELEELINYTWEKDDLRLINNRSLDKDSSNIENTVLDHDEVREFNANKLTIVLPNDKSIFTENYDPSFSWDTGCQFVAMHYQSVDEKMAEYMKKFKNSSFVKIPSKLKGQSYAANLALQKSKNKFIEPDKKKPGCPIKPEENNAFITAGFDPDAPVYKRSGDNIGVCMFKEKCDTSKGNWIELKGTGTNKTQGSLNLVLNNDETTFQVGKTQNNAGYDEDENNYMKWFPKLCCSKKTKNKPLNHYYLAPYCNDPQSLIGETGIKVEKKDADNLNNSFRLGNEVGKYVYAHPKLCKVNNNNLGDQKYCVVSSKNCPKGWNEQLTRKNKKITLENNWKLCCKNML